MLYLEYFVNNWRNLISTLNIVNSYQNWRTRASLLYDCTIQIKARPIHIKPILTDTDPNRFETCSLTDTNTDLQKQNN